MRRPQFLGRGRQDRRGALGAGAPRRYELGRGRSPLMQPPRQPLAWRRIVSILIPGAGALIVLALALWLVRGDALRVHEVRVVGAQAADAELVARAARLEGDSLLRLDADGAAERVRRVSGVKDARVRRDWPQTAVVEVTEHQGWGYWQAAGFSSVIDESGQVLERARPPAEGAPTIIAVAAEQPLEPGARVDTDTVGLAARLLKDGTLQRLGVELEAFEFQADRGLTVHVGGGPAAVFGDSHDYEFKVAAWAALLDRVQSEGLQANEIDLRFGRELVVR